MREIPPPIPIGRKPRWSIHAPWIWEEVEQKHDVANQAGAEGVDHLALTASQETSEEQEVDQASAEAAAFRALRTKVEFMLEFILEKKNIHNELKTMTRDTERALKVFVGANNQIRQGWSKPDISAFSQRECVTSNTNRDQVSPLKSPTKKKAKREAEKELPPIIIPTTVTEIQIDESKEPDWTPVVKRDQKRKDDNKQEQSKSLDKVRMRSPMAVGSRQ